MKTKRDELADQSSCFNRALQDEPVFVLLGRDPVAAETIRLWRNLRIAAGKNLPADDQLKEALALADAMERYAEFPF